MSAHERSNGAGALPPGIPRLTRRQLSIVREFAQGYDIATVAVHRGAGISSTYEITGRICARIGLTKWQEIGPWAIEHGLGDLDGHGNPE